MNNLLAVIGERVSAYKCKAWKALRCERGAGMEEANNDDVDYINWAKFAILRALLAPNRSR